MLQKRKDESDSEWAERYWESQPKVKPPYLNGNKFPLTKNGKRRHGQFEWHDENCQIQDFGIRCYDGKPARDIWCATHGQWAIERPTKVTYLFEDGSKWEKEL